MIRPMVIKVGGHEISDTAFLEQLARYLQRVSSPVVLVHGGGKEISTMQEKLGITPQYLDGVRITDAVSLDVVTMVLCGTVNKRVVQCLNRHGIDALGLSGIDYQLVQAQKMPHEHVDMAYTGEVLSVRRGVLEPLLERGVLPVIAPICYGAEHAYNVNADHVAGAIASAIGAERVVFLTNVEGVLVDDRVAASLTVQQAQSLIHEGIIYGGMIPKVQTALNSLQRGVRRAAITNLTGLQSHGGTVFEQ